MFSLFRKRQKDTFTRESLLKRMKGLILVLIVTVFSWTCGQPIQKDNDNDNNGNDNDDNGVDTMAPWCQWGWDIKSHILGPKIQCRKRKTLILQYGKNHADSYVVNYYL